MKGYIKFLIILSVLTLISAGIYYFIVNSALVSLSGIFLAFCYMPIPLVSLLILKFIFKENIDFGSFISIKKLNIKESLYTLFVFTLWVIIIFLLSLILGAINPEFFGHLISNNEELFTLLKQMLGEQAALSANLPPTPLLLVPISYISAVIAGITINLIFALGEEIGWRGYLVNEFRSLSFIKKYLLIGLIWGLWHSPIILQGYNYGVGNGVLGSLIFVAFCMTFSLLFGMIIERNHNAIYAAALHGMFNGFAGIFVIMLINYNPFIGGAIGIVSILSMIICFGILYILKKKIFKKD